MRRLVLLALLAPLPLQFSCGPDCAPAARDGGVALDGLALRDDGEAMRLEYRVTNGTSAAIYVHDGISRVLYDADAADLELTLAAPDFPDDIHVYGVELCYRRIPAGCRCDVRREVLREYTTLADDGGGGVAFESLPVHEADRVEVIVAWGDAPLEPDAATLTRDEYDRWRDDVQGHRLTAGLDRSPGSLDDELPAESEPTACPWITFP